MTQTDLSAAAVASPADFQPHVEFRDVRKTYDGETLVVKNLNLDISRGEFLTLLGPSGSGKTTSLMMLAGFEVPTSGDIRLAGRSIAGLPPHKRDIGMVFQNYALFPHMTVAENLAFPLSVRKRPRAETEERVARALRMVHLEKFGARRPAELSGGQQQRVALARALVFDPQLVLMDEPLGALDKQLREHMQLEIKHIHQSLGVTVVYVTHDQTEALTMSDRIAVFNHGMIQQIDLPDRLYQQPCNSFVANFIGENNRLTGVVRDISGGMCRVELPTGESVLATAVSVDRAGQPTTLSIRPERILLDRGASDDSGNGRENRLGARVLERIYLGDHLRLRLAVADNDDFMVKVPFADDAQTFQAGHDVSVRWAVEDCRALDPV
ncbi:ABC transporter ATP-binding protein [Skermanella sp. TT6]|uniref:Spermidine/putrescine import ATP-binding protein PotA n=1 Tax=Skermanella cutis TaxID=2775420 RepID=A0ABX7B6H5_9PROT|nr:ABC transporter ATP-binding protein [Skermanella sp. TT6]QQP88081.1 ABC transporter ATP-binding protein [Skermanella sp. TT6]